MELLVVSKKRRPSLDTDFELCIICQKGSTTDLRNLTKDGLPTFLKAMRLHGDDVQERLDNIVQDEESFLQRCPKYHRDCKSDYTHSRHQEKLSKKRTKSSDEANAPKNRRSVVNFKSCCFICNKERDSKGNRRLFLVATKTRQKGIYDKATYLQDESMLLKIQGLGQEPIDMIAADYRYHKTCLDNFMNKRKPSASSSTSIADEYERAY